MNNDTLKLLNKYNNNIKKLKIHKKNISGLLDLKNFKELIEYSVKKYDCKCLR